LKKKNVLDLLELYLIQEMKKKYYSNYFC